ncbi:MAG: hypothetical protein ACOYYU_20950 [Chloroflexota bacterium]
MKNKEKLRERFLRDPLPRRLGGLAATLGRISSSARNSTDPDEIVNLLEEAGHFIEWIVPETAPAIAAELKQMNIIIGMWKKSWVRARNIPQQRTLLAVQTKNWETMVRKFAGMISE